MANDCHYKIFKYNTYENKIHGPIEVKTWKKDLSPDELGVQGCSICEEDQMDIRLVNGLNFKICRKFAHIQEALNSALAQGQVINSIKGYIVKKTSGGIDEKGFRMKLSNHSFGTAVDINRMSNGLYKNCEIFGPHCQLAHGGEWNLNNPASIKPNSYLIFRMKESGLKWGGEIQGTQKDFMHFSPSGY